MKNNKHISLDEIGKELPFSVPDNYFNQFANHMDEQIGYKLVKANRFLKPWMYMAAMFVGVLLMGQVLYTVYQNNTSKNAENYELYVLSQVDETSLMDYYVDESVK
ncbi:MAG: hypothetical protein WCJ61_16985 [Paludibacter sp.]